MWGYLKKTEYVAQAEMHIQIDVHNRLPDSVVEVQSIYIFTGPGWSLAQDKTSCPSTEASLKPYSMRHFIKSPLTKFGPDDWARIHFEAKKTVWTQFSGDEYQEKYPIKGHMLMVISTTAGIVRSKIQVDEVLDESPF